MLDAQKLFLDLSGSGFRLDEIEGLSISKPVLFGRQPLQGLIPVFQNILRERYDFCRSIKAVADDWPHPRTSLQNRKPVDGARAYPEHSRQNRV